MKQTYKLEVGSYTKSVFSSGELNVRVEDTESYNCITGSPQSSDDILELLCLVDALRRLGTTDLSLVMPYVMYSRDDRVCLPGQQLGASVFAKLINSCNFTSVTTYDNHSQVITALLNNCTNVNKLEILNWYPLDTSVYDYFVAPDSGSIKQVQELSTAYQVPMLRADKTRSLETGEITGTVVYTDDLKGASCLIIDDLSACGRTFLELAKALKLKGAGDITLYVTHGFFNCSFDGLVRAGISKFITTDSVFNISEYKENLKHLGSKADVKVIKL